jgi:iron complex outermembrane receptor protein|tara:strand:+ start:2893 stop:5694 length:2802 start_codon:yes stop_codon:yes gene_type:complete
MKILSKLLLSFVISFTAFGSFNLSAQEVEEVVVTATRREESIQNLALSVQAFDVGALAESQITELADLSDYMPGFSYAHGIGSGSGAGVRGTSGAAIGAGTTSSVQMAINGHGINGSAFGEIGFLDVQQVEVLAGPQGTLFGRNAVGGLINLVTARPTAEMGGYANFELGNYGSERISTAINLPFGDNVRTRLAYSSFVKDGWIRNTGTGNDIDGRDAYGVRLSVDVDLPNESMIKFNTAHYSSDDNRLNVAGTYCARDAFYGCSPFEKGNLNEPYHVAGTIGGLIDLLTFLSPSVNYDPYASAVGMAPASIDTVRKNWDPLRTQVVKNTQIEYVKELTNVTVKAKYSYSSRDYQHIDDNDHSMATEGFMTALGAVPAWDVQFECFPASTTMGSEAVECAQADGITRQSEISVVSDFDGPHNFTAGVYQWQGDFDNDYHVQTSSYQMLRDFDQHPYMSSLFGGALNDLGGIVAWSVFGGVFGAVAPAIPTIGFPAALGLIVQNTLGTCAAYGGLCERSLPNKMGGLITDQNGITKSTALMAEYYYQMDDATKFTFGLRYNDDTYESTIFSSLSDISNTNYAYQGPDYSRSNPGTSRSQSENSALTYKLAVQRDLNDNSMVYASYTTGLKAGGTSPNEFSIQIPYGEEESASLEIGTRNILMDGRMLLNATLFEMDVTNGQIGLIYNAGAVNKTFDYVNTGLEGQMKFFISDNTELDFNWLALESVMGEALQDNPLNPNQASVVLGRGFATAGLTGLLQATGMDAATAAGTAAYIGTLLPNAGLTNWALTDTGIIGSYQGALITIPGLSAITPVQLQGNRFPGSTELDYNLSLTHRFAMDGGATDVRFTYVHKGQRYGSIFNDDKFSVPEQQYMDMTAIYSPSNDDWYAGAYVKNIGDKRFQIGAEQASTLQGGMAQVTYAQPRTYGLTFGMNF